MPRTSESEIDVQDQGPVAARETELADITASFVTFKEDVDMAPILANLPTRSCQCPHWGVLNKGGATVRYDDGRNEVIEPGDLYYVQPDGRVKGDGRGDSGVHGIPTGIELASGPIAVPRPSRASTSAGRPASAAMLRMRCADGS